MTYSKTNFNASSRNLIMSHWLYLDLIFCLIFSDSITNAEITLTGLVRNCCQTNVVIQIRLVVTLVREFLLNGICGWAQWLQCFRKTLIFNCLCY